MKRTVLIEILKSNLDKHKIYGKSLGLQDIFGNCLMKFKKKTQSVFLSCESMAYMARRQWGACIYIESVPYGFFFKNKHFALPHLEELVLYWFWF